MADTRPVRRPPASGTVFVAIGATLSAFALATGVLDVLIPVLVGKQSFSGLRALVEVFGPTYLFFHIFLHNLGMAFLVPGLGLLAAGIERTRPGRRMIRVALAGAVVLSMIVAAEMVIRRGYWTSLIVSPLLVLEMSAVLLLTWAGYRALSEYVPTPRPEWSWVKPARDLFPYAVIAAVALAFGAFVETLYLARTIGL